MTERKPFTGFLAFMLINAPLLAEDSASETKSPIYSPVGKRDPFRAPVLDKSARNLTSVNALEKYGIEKYQLKAILKGIGRDRAMFEDPDGKTFIISEGDRIGRERGTVSRILNTEVIITERTFNYLGRENLYERVLSLPPESEPVDGDPDRGRRPPANIGPGGGLGRPPAGGGSPPVGAGFSPEANAGPQGQGALGPGGGANIGGSNVK